MVDGPRVEAPVGWPNSDPNPVVDAVVGAGAVVVTVCPNRGFAVAVDDPKRPVLWAGCVVEVVPNNPVDAGAEDCGLLKRPKPPVPEAEAVGVAVLPNRPPPPPDVVVVVVGFVAVAPPKRPPGVLVEMLGVEPNIPDLDRASVVELGSKMLLRLAVGSAADGTEVSRFRLPNRLLLPVPDVAPVPVGPAPNNGMAKRRGRSNT